MKNLIIALGLVLSFGFSSSLMAQEKKSREERKKEKAEKIEQQYKATMHVLENKEFVLEANYISGRYGNRIPVSSSINFVSVDSSNAVLQLGSQSGVGYNGVGGITTEGQITEFDYTKNDKKNNFSITMNVMTNLGIYDVFMNVSADGYATARVHGLRGGQVTYTGRIVPAAESYVYKGTTTF